MRWNIDLLVDISVSFSRFERLHLVVEKRGDFIRRSKKESGVVIDSLVCRFNSRVDHGKRRSSCTELAGGCRRSSKRAF